MTRLARSVSWAIVGGVVLFLFAPVVLVVLFSFNSAPSTSFPLKGLSTRWYDNVFSNQLYSDAFEHTLVVAGLVVVVTCAVGLLTAMALTRLPPRLVAGFNMLLAVPIVIPWLFTGIALLSFFSRTHIHLSMLTVLIGHVVVTLPIVTVILSGRLARLDRAVIEAARDLGATSWQAFCKILLPQIAPTIVGAGLLAMAISVDAFIITLFVNGGYQTVPVVIFSSLRFGLDPSVNAIASLLILMTFGLTVLAGRFVANDLRRA
jgi:spermidine/putrescine transport system permease protein